MLVSNKNLLGTVTPTVYIDKVTLESSSDNGIRVIVNMVVKDTINNKFQTSWLGKKDFTKLIKIKIVQATTLDQYKILSERQNNNSTNLAKNRKMLEQFEFREYDLDSPVESSTGFLGKYTHEDSDGNMITDFNYRATFQINNPNPEHLSYFCFSYLDPMEFSNAFGIELPGNFDKLNGKISSDIVLNNSEILSSAVVFHDEDGLIWPGPVHKMPDGRWMTGAQHSKEDKYLVERNVVNTKIQDFRIMERISDAKIDLSALESVSIKDSKKPKILRNDETDVYKKQSYFTNAWTSRDEQNNSNFLFGMNIENFIKYNSKFGKLMDTATPAVISEILTLSNIRELKIYRKRVKNTPNINSLGTLEGPDERYDDILESDKMLFITGDVGGEIKLVDTESSHIREENGVTMPMETPGGKCRYFSVSDRKLKDFTYGLYQYGVEVKIEDGIEKYLQSILSTLKSARKSLSSYLIEAPIGYNPVAQRYTPGFVSRQNDIYRDLPSSPWIGPVVAYLNAFYTVTGDRSALDKAQGISDLLSPSDGNLEALEAFVLQFDKLLTSFHEMMGSSSSNRTSQGLLPGSNQVEKNSYSHGSSRIPLFIEFSHWFNNTVVNSEDLSTSGISYFSTKDNNSMRKITVEEFLQRQKFERDKINKQSNFPVGLDSFSILSPNYIKVDGEINSDKETEATVGDILSINFPNILTENGVSISNSKIAKLVPLSLQQSPSNEFALSVNTPPSVARTIDPEIEIASEQLKDISEEQVTELVQFQSQFLVQMVESNQPKKSTEYTGPPMPQALAEVLENASAGAIAPSFEDVDLSWVYDIDWSLVREIQVMTGYEKSDRNEKMLKAEKWETLTGQLYADDRLREKILLCRIVPYSNKEAGVKYNNNMHLPIYNEHFLLNGAPRVSIQTPDLVTVGPTSFTQVEQLASNYRTSTSINSSFMTTNIFKGEIR
jgi:hypothetical protein